MVRTVDIRVEYGGVPTFIGLWVGQRVDYTFEPRGGVGATTVTQIGGTIPDGLAFAAQRLSGTPTRRSCAR